MQTYILKIFDKEEHYDKLLYIIDSIIKTAVLKFNKPEYLEYANIQREIIIAVSSSLIKLKEYS